MLDQTHVSVCRNLSIGEQRGSLSGIGTITGDVFVNSGAISPDPGGTLHLGSLRLSPANLDTNTLGSLVHIEIDGTGSSAVDITTSAELAGTLESTLSPDANTGQYTILSSTAITGAFDTVAFTGQVPNYNLSYLPLGAPTFIRFDFLGYSPSDLSLSTNNLYGNNFHVATYLNTLAPESDELGLTNQFSLLNNLPFQEYQNALSSISPSRNSIVTFTAQNVMFMVSEALNSNFTKKRFACSQSQNSTLKEMALLACNDLSKRELVYIV